AYRVEDDGVRAGSPVIDLVALDPNNPRSIAYQVGRIEVHLATLPKRGDDTRLSAPEQIAIALATKVRTSDAAALDADAFVEAETSLMKLADVIAATYFTSRERSEAPWETFA